MNLRRKRMILMRDVWYGYNRTASGNPVTLEAAKRLRQLTIYGNAVQDGTPSPDAPVEVQLCGDRTGNLLDYDVFDNMPEYTSSSSNIGSFAVPLPNGVYTASTNIPLAPYAGMFVASSMPSDKWTTASYGVSAGMPRTVTVTDGVMYIGLYWRNVYDLAYDHVFTKEDFTTGMYWIMLTTGSEAQPYEPYGYKVSGRVTGVNLYNVNDKYKTWNTAVTDDAGWITVNYDNTEGTSGNWPSLYTNFRDVIEPSTEYTIVTEIEYISGCALYPNTTGSPKSAFNILFSYTQQGTHYMTVTSESDLSDCVTLLRSNYLVEPGNIGSAKFRISLLKGSYTADTIPPYEPYQPPQDFAVYLPQQIAKVGDVADTVVLDMEKRTAELRKNVGSVETDCASVVSLNDNRITLQCRNSKLSSGLYQSAEHKEMLNKYFPYIPNSSVDTEGVGPNMVGATYQTYVRINKSRIDITEEDTLETLADKCQAFLNTLNEPKTYYVLATPTTTDISALQDWDAMPQVKGTVTLTLSAEVPPSGAEAVYYSAERGD